jgi:hypothetical protein
MLGLYGCQQSLHLIFLSVYVFLPIISGLIFVLFFFCGGSSACRSSSSVAAFLSLADPLAEASTLGEVGSFLTLSFFGFATSDGLLLFSFLDFSFSFSPVAVFDFFSSSSPAFQIPEKGSHALQKCSAIEKHLSLKCMSVSWCMDCLIGRLILFYIPLHGTHKLEITFRLQNDTVSISKLILHALQGMIEHTVQTSKTTNYMLPSCCPK